MSPNAQGQATLPKERSMNINEEFRKRGYAPGEYFNKCGTCGEMFVGDKKAWCCFSCAAKEVGNVAKPNACHQLSDRSCGCCMSCLHWRYTGGGSGECMNLSIYRDESFYCSDYSQQC